MMMRFLLATALALATVDAATKVAVIELGESGVVHRSTSSYSETSAEGVASFFSTLHGYGRKLQHSGMTVVPDLFNRPDGGVIISISGVDLEVMPEIYSMMSNEGESGVVGHFDVEGSQSSTILKSIKDVEEVDADTLNGKVEEKTDSAKGIFAVKLAATNENASNIDAQVAALVHNMQKKCHQFGKTVVLHLVIEEEEGAARRQLMSRRLSEDEGGESGDGSGDNQDGDGSNNGYYGYGYYNAYGEWVTPYKTMFQIQYFNVVLWTSVTLVGVLLFSLGLMINMPLMADTLLFGESAKVPLDD
jgi:hypothetical protein